MKKIIVFFSVFFLITAIITGKKCREVIQKIDTISTENTTNILIKEATTEDKKKTGIKQFQKVRIVIMSNNYTSIYHSSLTLKGDNLKVYYGKNFAKQKGCKKVSLDGDSSYFKNSDVVKIYGKTGITIQGHNTENGSPVYMGELYLYREQSGMVVVNQVDMENYIAAVISSEIGEESPLEALKAQAVCARNFIMKSKALEYEKYKANADDSTDFQVYNRIKPGKNSKKAAEETKGVVMTYKNKLIKAYYFSTSCGYTTDYKIWGKEKMNYLKGENFTENSKRNVKNQWEFRKFIKKNVNGIESKYPFYRWRVYYTNEQLENSIYNTTGVNVGNISCIEVNERGAGGIASQITVYGDKRQIVMQNQNEIRKALCSCYGKLKLCDDTTRAGMTMLPSAFILLEKEKGGYTIYGGGFGHGSGMSQNGAMEMAKSGKNYKDILKSYYHGIEIKNAN